MNKILISILMTILLSGCTVFARTNSVAPQSGREIVDATKVLAFTEPTQGYAKVVITRDAGFMGSGCFIAVTADDVVIGRFKPKDTATFYLPATTEVMMVVPDPEGRGLCNPGMGWNPVEEKYVLRTDATNYFRISLGAYRRPRLLPQ